jgi:hypothetical protein
MNPSPPVGPETANDTGVADVRRVRERIAAQYDGDLRRHVADTDAIVKPLIDKLGLKEGVPIGKPNRPAATG